MTGIVKMRRYPNRSFEDYLMQNTPKRVQSSQ